MLKNSRSSFLIIFIVSAFLFPAPIYAELTTGMDADVVLGQPNFNQNIANNGGVSASSFNYTYQALSDGNRLFVTDYSNNRVLIWNRIPTANRTPADIVLGQPNFTTNAVGLSQSRMNRPWQVHSDGRRLCVTDYHNRRVLIWNSIPTVNDAPADVVVGQTNFTSNGNGLSQSRISRPGGCFFDGSRFYVSDYENHRILIWHSIPTVNGAPADVVLGQPDFTSNTPNNGGRSAKSFWFPYQVTSDGQRLFITDSSNYRVLIWNSIPTANFTPADVVVGQRDFSSAVQNDFSPSSTQYTTSAISDGTRLFVMSVNNADRVLVWNKIPTTNYAPADIVIGQPNFTADTAVASQNRLGSADPQISMDGKKLFVPDQFRVLIFNIAGENSGIELGPQFEQGKALLGKVFEDLNGNGHQDKDERGLEGVKIASDTGIYAITDEDGKYHFPFIQIGQRVLKIDESSLPDGSVITTESSRKVVVTKGILTKVSFGVQIPENEMDSRFRGNDTRMSSSGLTGGSKPLLKVSMSQDSAVLEPRLSVNAEIVEDEKHPEPTLVFTIDCNYFLFAKRAELILYDENYKEIRKIEIPKPLPSKYETPLSEFPLKEKVTMPLYYQLSVYDQKDHEDRTNMGQIELPILSD
jgi:hypothetical protein